MRLDVNTDVPWVQEQWKFEFHQSIFIDRSSKIQIFNDIWHSCFWRLWRPAYVTYMKFKGQMSIALEPTGHLNLLQAL